MANPKVTTTVRLDESLHVKLQEIANSEVRSVNNLIEYVLTRFVAERSASDSSIDETPHPIENTTE